MSPSKKPKSGPRSTGQASNGPPPGDRISHAKPPAKIAEPAPSTWLINAPIVEIGAGAFKDKCLQLLDQVRARTVEVLVTKHGEPVARLIAPNVQTASAFGFLRGTVSTTGDIVAPDFDAWDGAE